MGSQMRYHSQRPYDRDAGKTPSPVWKRSLRRLHTLYLPSPRGKVAISPSTEAYDRGDKFTQYREIESFEEYILISQDRPNVESLLRQPDGAWSILNYTGLESTARIRSLGVEIPMTEIYAGVEWAAPATDTAGAGAGG